MRYDIELAPTERFNRQTYFDFAAVAPLVKQAGLNAQGALQFTDSKRRAPEDTYWKQFGPRFGMAYQLRPRTVVRGGYGIFWLPGGLATSGTSSNNPIATIGTPFFTSLSRTLPPPHPFNNPLPYLPIPLPHSSHP